MAPSSSTCWRSRNTEARGLDHALDHAVAFPPGRRLHGTGPENTIFDRAALPGATQLRRYGFALLAIILVTMLGFLQRIFSTVELGFNQWAICAGIALSLLVVEELIKLSMRGRGAAPEKVYGPAGDGGLGPGFSHPRPAGSQPGSGSPNISSR